MEASPNLSHDFSLAEKRSEAFHKKPLFSYLHYIAPLYQWHQSSRRKHFYKRDASLTDSLITKSQGLKTQFYSSYLQAYKNCIS